MTISPQKFLDSYNTLLARVEVGLIPSFVQIRQPARVAYLCGTKKNCEVSPHNLDLVSNKRPLVEIDFLREEMPRSGYAGLIQTKAPDSELAKSYAQLRYIVDEAVGYGKVGAASIPSRASTRVETLLAFPPKGTWSKIPQEEMYVVALCDFYSAVLYASHHQPIDYELAATRLKGAAAVFDRLGHRMSSLLTNELAAFVIDKVRVREKRSDLIALSDQLNSTVARIWLEQLSDMSDPSINALAMHQGMLHTLFCRDWECAIKLLEYSMGYFLSGGYQRFAMKDKLRIAWVLVQSDISKAVSAKTNWLRAARHMEDVASAWKKAKVHDKYLPKLEQLIRDAKQIARQTDSLF